MRFRKWLMGSAAAAALAASAMAPAKELRYAFQGSLSSLDP